MVYQKKLKFYLSIYNHESFKKTQVELFIQAAEFHI